MPPPIALNLKVKYPDIYNRYRKLKGPIKATKPLKTRRTRAQVTNGDTIDGLDTGLGVMTAEQGDVDHQFADGNVQEMSDELARLASQQGHVDLAQALLRLPRGGQEGEQVHLDEAMLRMARMASGEEKMENSWEV